jgi:hypothetical protein
MSGLKWPAVTLRGCAAAPCWLAAVLSLGVAVSWPTTITAHDIYTALKDSSGRSCCSDHDCRPAHYRLSAAGVLMLVDGKCGRTGAVTVTFCAILPPSSALSTQAETDLSLRLVLSERADEVIE